MYLNIKNSSVLFKLQFLLSLKKWMSLFCSQGILACLTDARQQCIKGVAGIGRNSDH